MILLPTPLGDQGEVLILPRPSFFPPFCSNHSRSRLSCLKYPLPHFNLKCWSPGKSTPNTIFHPAWPLETIVYPFSSLFRFLNVLSFAKSIRQVSNSPDLSILPNSLFLLFPQMGANRALVNGWTRVGGRSISKIGQAITKISRHVRGGSPNLLFPIFT